MNELEIPTLLDDCLKELANVGSGHATGILSQLLNKRVKLGVPNIRFIKLNALKEKHVEETERVIAVYSQVHGNQISGNLIVIFPWQSSMKIKANMHKDNASPVGSITKEDESMFKEIGDALFQSYAEAINNFLMVELKYSDSNFVMSSPNSLLDLIVNKDQKTPEYVLVVSTDFNVEDTDIAGGLEISFIPEELDPLLQIVKKNLGIG